MFFFYSLFRKLNNFISFLFSRYCGSFSYTIPNDLFSDEDGNTRMLKIQFFDIYGNEVNNRTSWVQYNERLFLVYGLVKCSDVERQPNAGKKLFTHILPDYLPGQSSSYWVIYPDTTHLTGLFIRIILTYPDHPYQTRLVTRTTFTLLISHLDHTHITRLFTRTTLTLRG